MPTLPQRYDRIAPWYDLLDAGFERKRYAALRPLMFEGLGGQLLDAGVGTGRNCAYYPEGAVVSGIDTSPAMLARAEQRCPTLAAGGRLAPGRVERVQDLTVGPSVPAEEFGEHGHAPMVSLSGEQRSRSRGPCGPV